MATVSFPGTWAATPLSPDAVTPGPSGPFLRAQASQEYLALAIDTGAPAAGAPPRPGERRQREPPPVDASPRPEISEPELPDGDDVPDWSAPVADPRPAASLASLERSLGPHPLAFIHVDGREAVGPQGHGLHNVAERQMILSILAHCASTWGKQDLSILVI